MAETTYTLRYDGQEFLLNQADHNRLRKVYRTGLSVSGVLFDFVPVGAAVSVAISIGSGARFTITSNAVG